MSGTVRASIQRGAKVSVVLKCDQPTGKLTLGVVDALLTNSAQHPQGIKVRLRSGQVGRVKTVHESGDGAEVTSTHQGVIDGGYTGRGSPNNWNRTNNRSRRSPNSQRPSPGGSIAESSNAYRERHRKFGTSARVVNDGYGDDDMSAYMRPSSAEGNVLSAWLAPQLDDGNNDEMDWTTNESPSGLESAENTRVWVCAACTFENSPGSGHCEMCTSVKPVFTSTISPASTPDAETTGQGAQSAVWACVACTYENDQMFSLACAVCSTPRTG